MRAVSRALDSIFVLAGDIEEYYGTENVGGKPAKTEKQREGRCYQLAGAAAAWGAPQGSQVVHGTMNSIFGHDPIEHAWVEHPDGSVWEPLQGKHWPKPAWDAIVRPSGEKKYHQQEILRNTQEHGHWGPWEE